MFDTLKDFLDPPIRNHKIFFFHIAKCGGTSIANAIAKCYKPWRPAGAVAVIELNESAARFSEAQAIDGYRMVRRDLLNYYMSLPRVRCISGHFQYSNIAHDVYGDSWRFVTILRDPVRRFISHYQYNLARGRLDIPIEAFIETSQGRSFGRAFVDEVTEDLDRSGMTADELTTVALTRYRKFSLVGRIEDTADFCARFEEIFGHGLKIPHLNRTSSLGALPEISANIRSRIENLCAPDLHVYRQLFPNA
jgi:hypothetical protein